MVNEDSAWAPTGREALRALRLDSTVRALVSSGPLSRTEIAATTGFSPATVTGIVRELQHMGIVTDAGQSASTGGRRRALVDLDRHRVAITVVTIEGGLVVAGQIDLQGQLLAQTRVRMGSGGALAAARTAVAQLHAMADLDSRCLVLSVPGVVGQAGDVSLAPSMGPLPTRQVGEFLKQETCLPVIVENDVNLIALGEQAAGSARGDDVVVLHVGDGIGATVLLGGRVFSGSHRSAGEIGFLPWGGAADPTMARGALEGHWSTPAIADKARRRGLRTDGHVLDVMQADAPRQPEAARLLAEVLEAWAYAAVACCCVIDPELIVLSGDATRLWDDQRARLATAVLDGAPAPVEVAFAVLGDDAVLHGATAAVLQRPDLLLHAGPGSPA